MPSELVGGACAVDPNALENGGSAINHGNVGSQAEKGLACVQEVFQYFHQPVTWPGVDFGPL